MISFKLSFPMILVATISTILIIRILHKYFLKPYFLLQQFKKYKGCLCIYRPVIGIMREILINERQHGDAAFDMKRRVMEDPSLRVVASPIMDRVQLSLYDSDLVKQFLNKESMVTIKYTGMFSKTPEFLKNGLVFTEGEKWKRQRKLISQVFHFDYMNNSLPIIRATAKEWIDNHCKISTESASPSFAVVDVSKELKMYSSTVLWRIFFGEDRFLEGQSGPAMVEVILNNIATTRKLSMSLWNFIFGARFFSLGLREIDRQYNLENKIIKRLFYSKFEQSRESINAKTKAQQSDSSATNATSPPSSNPSFKNLIELLIQQSEGLPDLEIVSQIYTFFMAGTDTTSELLTTSHYLLATHPEVQAKLREEVITEIGRTEEIKYDHISKMEYLNAVIKEALRFGSPALTTTPRIATQDFMLGEIGVKKGTVVTVDLMGLAFNPKYFSQPEEFRPERWIEKKDPGAIDTSTHLPFSAGARRCIGEQLALIESKVMLCELVRQFNIELKTPFELKMGVGLVYRVNPPVNVVYTPIQY